VCIRRGKASIRAVHKLESVIDHVTHIVWPRVRGATPAWPNYRFYLGGKAANDLPIGRNSATQERLVRCFAKALYTIAPFRNASRKCINRTNHETVCRIKQPIAPSALVDINASAHIAKAAVQYITNTALKQNMRKKVFFSVPLAPRIDEEQFASISLLLSSTLRSLQHQTDDDFEVIICGHDKPDIPELADNRVTWMTAKFDRQSDRRAAPKDKQLKRRHTIKEACRRGGGYIMLMDADDLARADLVHTIREINDPFGYLLNNGYAMDRQSMQMAPITAVFNSRFWEMCGSCAAIYLTQEDVDSGYAFQFRKHREWYQQTVEANRPLRLIGAPLMAYVLNTVSNESNRYRNDEKTAKIVELILQNSVDERTRSNFHP